MNARWLEWLNDRADRWLQTPADLLVAAIFWASEHADRRVTAWPNVTHLPLPSEDTK